MVKLSLGYYDDAIKTDNPDYNLIDSNLKNFQSKLNNLYNALNTTKDKINTNNWQCESKTKILLALNSLCSDIEALKGNIDIEIKNNNSHLL